MSGRSPRWIPSKLRTRLSDLTIGSTIKLNEGGSPVEFYVAKHDYEPELNGNGRTLLVRKDCYDERPFGSDNAFSGSSIGTWLNNTWLKLLDANVQTAISTTKFYCVAGKGSSTVKTVTRSVFLLSTTELGDRIYADGTALDPTVCSRLVIAYYNGSAVAQLTRTPRATGSAQLYILSSTGSSELASAVNPNGSRPTFTLPSDFLVTNDMLA